MLFYSHSDDTGLPFVYFIGLICFLIVLVIFALVIFAIFHFVFHKTNNKELTIFDKENEVSAPRQDWDTS
jgi:TM2 domain-containing membrane protein YozV